MKYEGKPGMLAMTTNMYIDRQTTTVTKQFKTTITIHLTPFISLPVVMWQVWEPLYYRKKKLLLCTTYAYFPKQGFTLRELLLNVSPVLQERYNATPMRSEVYTKQYRLRLRVHHSRAPRHPRYERWSLIFWAELLQFLASRTKLINSSHAQNRKRQITVIHRSLKKFMSSTWNFLAQNLYAGRIFFFNLWTPVLVSKIW
jgi:hypothetical protein